MTILMEVLLPGYLKRPLNQSVGLMQVYFNQAMNHKSPHTNLAWQQARRYVFFPGIYFSHNNIIISLSLLLDTPAKRGP